MSQSIGRLVELLTERNRVDAEIARLIGRPALIGHIGEWIAAQVFDIQLEASANARGIDGRFRTGPLAGQSVNVKCYGKREGGLDIQHDALPDHYLVLCGPTTRETSSAGGTRPFVIEEVFLFDAARLVAELTGGARPVKLGDAASVRRSLWNSARVYPAAEDCRVPLTPEQCAALRLLAGPPRGA